MKKYAAFFLFLSVILCGCRGTESPVEYAGIKYSGSNPEFLRRIGMNIVLDRGQNEELQKLCIEQGIGYWRIYNVFTATRPAIESTGSVMLGEHGEAPSGRQAGWDFFSPAWERMRKAKVEAIAGDVKLSRPDGISLDIARWYMEAEIPGAPGLMAWESIPPDGGRPQMISYSFDPETLERFQRDTGITLEASSFTPSEAASEILSRHSLVWAQWKSGLVAETVAEIREAVKKIDPEIKIMVQTVPWEDGEYGGAMREVIGQDAELLAGHTDIFSPMAYHPLLGRPAEWVGLHTARLAEKTGVDVWPCIQARELARLDQTPFTAREAVSAWRQAESVSAGGIVLYGPREQDEDVIRLLSEFMGARRNVGP